MSKKLKVATVFSGIGAAEQALKKLNKSFEIVFACDNGEREIEESYEEIMKVCKDNSYSYEEIQNYVKEIYNKTKKINRVKESYFANYDIDEKRWYEDIRFIDGNNYKGNVDIFIGGSPCQSYSMMGKRAGLEDARGTLFYDYARLVKEISPEVFIYENVPGMLNHDGGNTWKVIKEIFESLNYRINFTILNAKDYGIPQNRKRLFVVGFKNKKINFKFPGKIDLTSNLFDYLEPEVDAKFYLGKKGFEFVTSHKGRACINNEIIRTQKANQQFNWNGDFIFEPYEKVKDRSDVLNRAYVGIWNNEKGVIRQLTHRECMRLMGFSEDYKIVVPNVAAYRQAGNSIVVNVLENIFKEIFKAREDYEAN